LPDPSARPCPAAWGLAGRGWGGQPLGAGSQPSPRAAASGSVRPWGRGEKGFWISYTYPALLLFGRCDLADATPASRLLWQPIGAPGDYDGRDRRDDHVRGR